MNLDEAKKLPWRVVWFGTTQNAPVEIQKFIKPEQRNLPLVLHANFAISPDLKEKLTRVCAVAREGKPADAWTAEGMGRLLTLQDECLESFAACAAESRRKEKGA